MKLGLINSALAQAGRETSFGILKTKELGFDSIDIFADPLETGAEERALIRRTAADCGLPIISVCCVATVLIDFNLSVQKFHLERCKAFLDFVAELGARNLLLVLGEYIWQREVIPPEEQWDTAVRNTGILGEYAGSRGVRIALELEPFNQSLLNSVEEMVRFIGAVGMPGTVRANCDISHLHLVCTPFEKVASLRGLIEHVHLSDCNGRTHGDLPPGRGITPIEEYLEAIRATGYDGAVSIELEYSPEPAKIEEWVAEAYRETDKIMQRLGCRN